MNNNNASFAKKASLGWYVLPTIVVSVLIKYLIGFRNILYFDDVIFGLMIIILTANLFIEKHKTTYKINGYLLMTYAGLGMFIPSFEYISLTASFIGGISYILPLIAYLLLIKYIDNKKP